MPDITPPESPCRRCKQTRPLFPYKPLHDCVKDIGPQNLIEAALSIAWIEDNGDRWCTARIERRDQLHLLCVRCHDREAADEQEFIDDVLD